MGKNQTISVDAHLFRPRRRSRVFFYLQLAVFSLEVNAIDHIDPRVSGLRIAVSLK